MVKIPGSRGHAMFWYVIAAIEITFAAVYPFRAPHAGIIIGLGLVAGLLAIVEARKSEATGKYNADAHVAKQCKDSTEKNRFRNSGKSGRK